MTSGGFTIRPWWLRCSLINLRSPKLLPLTINQHIATSVGKIQRDKWRYTVRTLTARKVPSRQQELFPPLASDNILGRRYCCVSMEGGGKTFITRFEVARDRDDECLLLQVPISFEPPTRKRSSGSDVRTIFAPQLVATNLLLLSLSPIVPHGKPFCFLQGRSKILSYKRTRNVCWYVVYRRFQHSQITSIFNNRFYISVVGEPSFYIFSGSRTQNPDQISAQTTPNRATTSSNLIHCKNLNFPSRSSLIVYLSTF